MDSLMDKARPAIAIALAAGAANARAAIPVVKTLVIFIWIVAFLQKGIAS